ncbi:glycosyltransferase [Flavobacterium sp. GT3R68]|uniref:glycosyltransferase n=1 Tax=Flavobacterium sp. GT3R68 TaxID=2594437 RepID=UPI000F876507|nr:glycosyltransferase [Flavobacterium sp. GT3R68]RTY92270.1 glycosyltransferase [Flavobacterium sp. GSN2]TRW92506.1 glycosyltransferase [Flavobacterium sp. GT3R68]
MTKSLLIAAPYLDNIGGTEIEAVTTAVHFWDSGEYNKVTLFSPEKINAELFLDMIGTRAITYLKYPSFFKTQWVGLFNRLFYKMGASLNCSEYLFWKYNSVKFDDFFILTYPKSTYFFPIIKNKSQLKKYIAKITMWQFEPLPSAHIPYYKKLRNIIVFNREQKYFWQSKNQLKNTVSLDIMIPNEKQLLEANPFDFNKANLTFGYLGRISREKNIEDMLYLLDFLNNKHNRNCKLIIQGKGEETYVKEINTLIKELSLTETVTLENEFLSPTNTHYFFEKIDIFLVTSKNEGGPMTALEAAACGRMVMGYDIGAMKERFGHLPYMVNTNFDELCTSVLNFMDLEPFAKSNLLSEVRNHYIVSLSNSNKGNALLNLFKD